MPRTDPRGLRPGFVCCGVHIDPLSPERARHELNGSVYGRSRTIHLCNAFTLSLALRVPSYRELLNQSDLNLADGQPVAWVGRRLGHTELHASVRGPGLMRDVIERGQQHGLRHYFYGSTPEVCERLREEVRRRFPDATVTGVEAPPFRRLTLDEEHALVARIRDSRPDIVWVGLGTPRQDQFVSAFRDRLDTTLVAIGAGFDFLAGTKRSAPGWMQRSGLEWLFRLATEPRRLWRRYLVGNIVFLYGALRDLRATRSRPVS